MLLPSPIPKCLFLIVQGLFDNSSCSSCWRVSIFIACCYFCAPNMPPSLSQLLMSHINILHCSKQQHLSAPTAFAEGWKNSVKPKDAQWYADLLVELLLLCCCENLQFGLKTKQTKEKSPALHDGRRSSWKGTPRGTLTLQKYKALSVAAKITAQFSADLSVALHKREQSGQNCQQAVLMQNVTHSPREAMLRFL